MSDDKEKCAKDSRPVCKYGVKCYQKNPEHGKKYKHPPKPSRKPQNEESPPRKILKREDIPSKSPQNDTTNPTDKLEMSIDNEFCDNTASTSPSKTAEIEKSPQEHLGFHEIPEDCAKSIKEKFLVEMPDDFYSFWEFCKSLSSKDGAKNVLKSVNLIMVGPFDVLLENLPIRKNSNDYLLHWRFFYDPPEFQTIFASPGNSEFHMGYFRDSPSESPCFVASNEVGKGCKIKPIAENVFGAILSYLEMTKKKSPFTSIACQKLITPLKEWANKNNFTLETNTPLMKKRMNSVVTKTFHGAGILFPYNRTTQLGYRRLAETDAKIKEMVSTVIEAKDETERNKALAPLQLVITNANIATDECDFGTGFELGMDFFCTGEKIFHASTKQLLTVAYNMLNRNEYAEIIKAHLDNRRKGTDVSCANL